MPRDDLFSDQVPIDDQSSRPQQTSAKNSKPGRITPKQAAKLTMFENVHASKAEREDILRAHNLYHRSQDKHIKSKITKLFFN